MGDDFLTFDELRKVQSKERNKDTLQHLDSGFFNRARNYLQMKQDNGSYVENKEYRNAKNILEDIIHRRQKKVVKLAVLSSKTNVKVENLLPGEQQLFNSVEGLIDSYRDELYEQLFDDEPPENISAPTVSGGSAELADTEDDLLDDDTDIDIDDDLSDTEDEAEDTDEEDDNPFSVADEPETEEEDEADAEDNENEADPDEIEDAQAEDAEEDEEDTGTEEDTADETVEDDGTDESDGSADDEETDMEEVDEYADEEEEEEMSAEEADALLDVDNDADESSESTASQGDEDDGDADGSEDLSTGDAEDTAEDDDMETSTEVDDSDDGITITITEDVPEFMGVDLEAYGPFEEGDTATVPEENANVLLSQDKAEEA